MNWFYLASFMLFLLIGMGFYFYPAKLKILISVILKRDLLYLFGIIEVILGLGTLYYKNVTKLKWFVYIVGFMLFIDGILYLIPSKPAAKAYNLMLNIDSRSLKTYASFMILISIGYLFSSILIV